MTSSANELLALLSQNLEGENPRPLAVFSDFDGTLAAIAPTPDEAHILPQALDALQELAQVDDRRVLVGILSGRRLSELRRKLPLKGILLAGNHGLEIATPVGVVLHRQARSAKPEFAQFKATLKGTLRGFPGAWIEDKELGLAVHYRQLAPELSSALAAAISEAAAGLKTCRLMHGRCVWELRPAIDWDKGRALAYMLDIAKTAPEVLALYLGDDTTDEDAFREVNRRAGISILVSEDHVQSCATHRLGSPGEVADFLSQLALLYNG